MRQCFSKSSPFIHSAIYPAAAPVKPASMLPLRSPSVATSPRVKPPMAPPMIFPKVSMTHPPTTTATPIAKIGLQYFLTNLTTLLTNSLSPLTILPRNTHSGPYTSADYYSHNYNGYNPVYCKATVYASPQTRIDPTSDHKPARSYGCFEFMI